MLPPPPPQEIKTTGKQDTNDESSQMITYSHGTITVGVTTLLTGIGVHQLESQLI